MTLLNHLTLWFVAWLLLAAPTAVLLGLCIAAGNGRDDEPADTDALYLPESWLR